MDIAAPFAAYERDFMRAYRSGASTADVESQSRAFKTHRAMLDCFFTFVREENTD